MTPEFIQFPKIARLSRDVIVTEKIDGTNAQIMITEDGDIFAGSRSRWLTADLATKDNYGFARWVEGNKSELLALGPGRHFGEWWGKGIQRGYGVPDKRFSLFNVTRWKGVDLPAGITTVPVVYEGIFWTDAIDAALGLLQAKGSYAAPGFMDPEGIVVFHTASNTCFKKTIKGDESPKSLTSRTSSD